MTAEARPLDTEVTPEPDPAPPFRRRRRADGAELRARLLEAAVQEFGEKGYTAATLEAIAEKVGLTRQGVLRRFPSKEALFAEVLADQRRWAHDHFAPGSGQRDAGDDPDRFELADLRPQVPSGTDPGAPRYRLTMAQVMQGEAITGEGAARDFAVGRLNGVCQQIVPRVELARRAGRLTTDVDVAVVATLLTAAMNGLQAHWLLDETARTGEAFDLLLSLLVGADPDLGSPAPGTVG